MKVSGLADSQRHGAVKARSSVSSYGRVAGRKNQQRIPRTFYPVPILRSLTHERCAGEPRPLHLSAHAAVVCTAVRTPRELLVAIPRR
jgi:hypothetical protein